MRAKLALEDGIVLEGDAFGFTGEKSGEVVFNTSMTGYQEILTDPSYAGQIVTMTYPLIGNYGLNSTDVESARPHVEGFIIRERSRMASSYRSQQELDAYLAQHEIIGLEGVDTRALTKHIRTKGAMTGVLSTEEVDNDTLVDRAKAAPKLVGRDLVQGVTCAEAYDWTDGVDDNFVKGLPSHEGEPYKVVAIDYGIKYNILRCLVSSGCSVKVLPAQTTAAEVLAEKPDGVFLSNGPGDPEPVTYAADCVRELMGKVPLFGICLGSQIMGIALGGKTAKLKFGHRGGNQPVMDLTTGKVEITAQNHGFVVDADTLNPDEVMVSHINLNDKTVEGLSHKSLPAFSVQYHPEASPGPHDALYLFERFTRMMAKERD
ncbi:MAG: glutamine-hydrolyzing carbamoyl-phosphate synthase small subunit [Planctomycetota bacterium]|nr:glutamine-hydrolyzing carbamoyl-phosphate synthase small subunit [Planctomycetota bacterium]